MNGQGTGEQGRGNGSVVCEGVIKERKLESSCDSQGSSASTCYCQNSMANLKLKSRCRGKSEFKI